jgi:hypothetical protein
MSSRFYILAATVTLMIGVTSSQLFAKQLKLQVDRQSGALSLTGADADAVDFAGYQVRSQRGTLENASWNGLRDTEADWVVIGTPSANSVAEVNSNGNPTAGAVVNNTVSFDLGNAYDSAAIVAGLSLGQDVETNDLSLVYYDQIFDTQLAGVVEFVGEKIFNNIGVTVDLSNGKAYLENESPNALTINGYTIESSSGLLNVGSGYAGLGGSFHKAPAVPDGNGLGELDPTGAGKLLASSMAANVLGFDLGTVVANDPTSLFLANGDLTFNFILDGVGAASRTGFVKFINIPAALPGDFNGDLVVDAADYTVWRDNLGAPTDDALMGAGDGFPGVDAGDFAVWTTNFGQAGGTGAMVTASVSAVPEPGTAMFCVAAGLTWIAVNRQRHTTKRIATAFLVR